MKNLSLTNILILALFIVTFLLLRQCDVSRKEGNRANKAESTIVHDTTYIMLKGKPDTIYDTIVAYHTDLIPVYVHDTVTIEGDSLSIYATELEDSLIKGRITSTVKGELLMSDFEYTAKFPKYIYRTDTFKVQIDSKETIIKDPWEFYLGGVVGGNSARFNLQPSALIRVPKKGFMVGYGYDVIHQTHNAHLYTRIKWL